MKKQYVLIAVTMILLFGIGSAFGQEVSEEAKRHFDRGMAALEMAKSPNDYAAAINEFEQAARLAPDWPDVYYNLGKVQEAAEKYNDAIKSYWEYLRLAPDAEDAEEIKSLINKLEYKAEQILTIPDIVDTLFSLNGEGWQGYYRDDSGVLQKTKEGKFNWDEITRVDDHSFRVNYRTYKSAQGQVRDVFYNTISVSGPVIKFNRSTVYLDKNDIGIHIVDNDYEIEVISRNHVKIQRTSLDKDSPLDTNGFKHDFYLEFRKIDVDKNTGNAAANNPAAPARPPTGAGNINVNNESADADQMVDLLSGNKKEAEQLLAQGADVNIKNKDGQTPLHVAIQRVDKEVVEFLISKGADVNSRDKYGQTPLHEAACSWRLSLDDTLIEIAKLLIARSVDVNAEDKSGCTPLMRANERSNKSLAKLLKKYGAK